MGKSRPRDIYLGEDKQTMILFRRVCLKSSTLDTGVAVKGLVVLLAVEAGVSTSTDVACDLLLYVSLKQRCPAALYLILADRDLVRHDGV